METADWVGVVGIAATVLVGILVPILLQNRSIESRLGNEIGASRTEFKTALGDTRAEFKTALGESEARVRAENREAHALIGSNIDSARTDLTGRIDAIDARDRKRALLAALGD